MSWEHSPRVLVNPATLTLNESGAGNTVFAGADEVATVSGPQAVGEDYVYVTVEGSDIIDGLVWHFESGKDTHRGPGDPYMRLTRVRVAVRYELAQCPVGLEAMGSVTGAAGKTTCTPRSERRPQSSV